MTQPVIENPPPTRAATPAPPRPAQQEVRPLRVLAGAFFVLVIVASMLASITGAVWGVLRLYGVHPPLVALAATVSAACFAYVVHIMILARIAQKDPE